VTPQTSERAVCVPTADDDKVCLFGQSSFAYYFCNITSAQRYGWLLWFGGKARGEVLLGLAQQIAPYFDFATVIRDLVDSWYRVHQSEVHTEGASELTSPVKHRNASLCIIKRTDNVAEGSGNLR
jgi:hypothetical protein